jgi:hypothetical protein
MVVVTDILVQPVCHIFDGQDRPLKKRVVGCPATSVYSVEKLKLCCNGKAQLCANALYVLQYIFFFLELNKSRNMFLFLNKSNYLVKLIYVY